LTGYVSIGEVIVDFDNLAGGTGLRMAIEGGGERGWVRGRRDDGKGGEKEGSEN
jgi:hypothetical protein